MVGIALASLLCAVPLGGCDDADDGPTTAGVGEPPLILVDTSFLADITRNVAGDEWSVHSLVPTGADPHSFEPTPQDAQAVAQCEVMVINTVGLIPTVDELIAGAGKSIPLVIEAAAGLTRHASGENKGAEDTHSDEGREDDDHHEHGQTDPHFWLDPTNVIVYAENIADGLGTLDPTGANTYVSNAALYAEDLRELDAWILEQAQTIPPERRLLVTNHESLGRFADRYGFVVVGTIFPSTAGEGSPSARQLASLVEEIRATEAPAIFLETGSNADLAEQVAREAGIALVTDLYTHSLGEDASSYLEMMRWNATRIVQALR
jgi:ABC-type Zn uptake system ZnuABC Zn-binding protein ZnuA